jgi:hypothetical protein
VRADRIAHCPATQRAAGLLIETGSISVVGSTPRSQADHGGQRTPDRPPTGCRTGGRETLGGSRWAGSAMFLGRANDDPASQLTVAGISSQSPRFPSVQSLWDENSRGSAEQYKYNTNINLRPKSRVGTASDLDFSKYGAYNWYEEHRDTVLSSSRCRAASSRPSREMACPSIPVLLSRPSRRQSPCPKNGARHYSRSRAPKKSADIRVAKSMACVEKSPLQTGKNGAFGLRKTAISAIFGHGSDDALRG